MGGLCYSSPIAANKHHTHIFLGRLHIMPNWASNQLTLSHTDPKMIKRAIKGFLDNKLLNEFIPVPEDLHIMSGSHGAGTPEQKELEAQQAANLAKYGYKDWYDYSVAEWGTKWDVGGEDDQITELSDEQVIFSFESAWSPPIAAYYKLQEMGFKIDAMYYEPGCAFCGHFSDDGDAYYEIPATSDEVADAIPSNIDEAFAIAENMAMWEEDA